MLGNTHETAAVWTVLSTHASTYYGVPLDYDLVDQSDGFNFVIQGGVGLRYWLPERRRGAVDLPARFHHISNAGLRLPDLSIESFQLFVTYVFPIR